MTDFTARDPDFEVRVRRSFARQKAMATLGASLDTVQPGAVSIQMPFCQAFSQQHGFMHAGAVTSILDSACGYAALSLMPSGTGVLTVEFKTNLLAPTVGELFIAYGSVIKSGRTLMVCEGRAIAHREGHAKDIALMTATMMVMSAQDSVQD